MPEKKAGPDALPQLVEPGLWIERRGNRSFAASSPALFLDRDGTLNVDTGYPDNPDSIILLDHALPAIRAANAAGMPVVIVTNQSGVARGFFPWGVFEAVQARVIALLREEGCAVDLMLACAYHEAGQGDLRVADHPMRKPRPGMLLQAAKILPIDLGRSAIVGDSTSDMQAGAAAGLARGFYVGEGERPVVEGFRVGDIGEAVEWVVRRG